MRKLLRLVTSFRLRFSLRAFLLFVSLLAIGLGYKANQVRRERLAVAPLKNPSISLVYDYQHRAIARIQQGVDLQEGEFGRARGTSSGVPSVLQQALGEEFFHSVTAVELGNDCRFIRSVLPRLRQLPKLREIYLMRRSSHGAFNDGYLRAEALLREELPHVKVTPYHHDKFE